MKIVKSGNRQKAEKIKKSHWWVGCSYVCSKCDCIVVLEADDAQKMQIADIDTCGEITSYSVPCPFCFSDIDLEESNATDLVNCKDCGKEFDRLDSQCKHCRNNPYEEAKTNYGSKVVTPPYDKNLCKDCFNRRFPDGCFRIIPCNNSHAGDLFEQGDNFYKCDGKAECFVCKDKREREGRRNKAKT